MNGIKKLNTVEDYENFLKNHQIAIVKISAVWCGPCRVLEQTILNLDNAKLNDAAFGEIDADSEAFEDTLAKLNVRGIPVMIYYKDGVEAQRSVGNVTADDIYNRISTL